MKQAFTNSKFGMTAELGHACEVDGEGESIVASYEVLYLHGKGGNTCHEAGSYLRLIDCYITQL